MKNLNNCINQVMTEQLNKGVHDVPKGLLIEILTDPFGEYRFTLKTVKNRLDELVDRGFIISKSGFYRMR